MQLPVEVNDEEPFHILDTWLEECILIDVANK